MAGGCPKQGRHKGSPEVMGCELNSSGSSDPSKSLCYTVGSQVTALDGRASGFRGGLQHGLRHRPLLPGGKTRPALILTR